MGPREIQRGQTLSGIPADSWNAFVDAARKINAGGGRGNGQASSDRGSTVFVLVRNYSNTPVQAGGVIALGEIISSPTARPEVVFEGLRFDGFSPQDEPRPRFYAVALEPIGDTNLGWCVIPGATWAKVNITNEDHRFAEPGATTSYLESKLFRGLPIVWKETGTGEKWAIVSFRGFGIEMELANELIDAMSLDADAVEGEMGYMGGIGSVRSDHGVVPSSSDCLNITGRPIWNGAKVYLSDRGIIIGSDSADLLAGDWNGSGSKTNIESYVLSAAGLGYFASSGVANSRFTILDPLGLLTAVTSGSPGVIFATGGTETPPFNILTVIGTEVGGSGGGGDPWVGWPGPDPSTGTAPVKIFKALVNNSGGVTSAGSVPFDGTTSIIGTAPASGTATNPGVAFADNEPIYVVASNTNNYYALKLVTNVIKAQVNVSGGVATTDATFAFDGATAIIGTAPVGGTGTAENVPGSAYVDNEFVELQQGNNGNWYTTSIGVNLIKALVNEASHVAAGTTTFAFDGATAIIGTAPAGGTGTANNAMGEIFKDNEEIWLIQRNDKNWHPVKIGKRASAVLGQATAAVTGGSFSIDNIELVYGDDPRSNTSSTSETLSVSNPFTFDIDNNGQVLAEKKANGTWIATQAACPA